MDDWSGALSAWLSPFLSGLKRREQRRWAPVYVEGLLGPGDRKSVEPMSARVAPGEVQQLHHFISGSTWDGSPLEAELCRQADRLVGGRSSFLIVDDTALVKQGSLSVGVQRQYCGQLGKKANCQSLVSLTVARGEVPICVGLRLFLPESWASDEIRRARAGVPAGVTHQPKWRMALDEIDRVKGQGLRFGYVLGDAEYGKAAAFRHGLSERGCLWAVGIMPVQKVFPIEVRLLPRKARPSGRRPKHLAPDLPSRSVEAVFADPAMEQAFTTLIWRRGTKGPLRVAFAACRVRVADGPVAAGAQHLPGEEAWLVCERRSEQERRYYLANLPPDTSLRTLARIIKARWVCEQAHQQMKEELGLDHFEGRSWRGLHHHTLMTMIAFVFLQHLRLGGKKAGPAKKTRATASTFSAKGQETRRRLPRRILNAMSQMQMLNPISHHTLNLAE